MMPTRRGAPLRTTTYAQETFGSARLESPATVRGFDDSARRRRNAAAHSSAGVATQTKSERRARTPATRGKSKKVRRKHDKRTPVGVAVDQVLENRGPVRHFTFDDEDTDASETREDETAQLRRELDEARVALRLVEESRSRYKKRYIEARKAQARESPARKGLVEMLRSRNEGCLTFRRLLTDEKLRKACNALTGWRTPEMFEALWRYVDGGEKHWSDRCNLWHESEASGIPVVCFARADETRCKCYSVRSTPNRRTGRRRRWEISRRSLSLWRRHARARRVTTRLT